MAPVNCTGPAECVLTRVSLGKLRRASDIDPDMDRTTSLPVGMIGVDSVAHLPVQEPGPSNTYAECPLLF